MFFNLLNKFYLKKKLSELKEKPLKSNFIVKFLQKKINKGRHLIYILLEIYLNLVKKNFLKKVISKF